MSIELVIPSNHLILCCPLLLLLWIFPTIRVFSKESVLLIRWPKYWSFSFSFNPSNDYSVQFSSVQFSLSVMSDSLWLHESQHARPLCPSPTLGVYPNSCSLSWWCHPTISSSVVPVSSCLQSFPASGSFPMSWVFASGGQSIGASASASVLPMNIRCWFLLKLTDLILLFKGLSIVFSSTTVQKHQLFSAQTSLWSNSHISAWLLKKTIALTIQTFVSKVMSLLFNTLSRLVITFIPKSKCLLISWLQSSSAVILEPQK